MATLILLTLSNVFMTFAWYYHLKSPSLQKAPLLAVILVSWGIAFFEYVLQVPGNRLGARAGFSAGQLKIMQEAITLVVFCIFAWIVLGEKPTWNYYVGFGFVLVGVFFVFNFKQPTPAIGPQVTDASPRAGAAASSSSGEVL